MTDYSRIIGSTVTVTIDRPMGSYHPEHKDMYYPVNYGYIEGMIAQDGEEQDVYVFGVDHPVKKFTGRVIAVIHRDDDCEEKWCAVPEGTVMTASEINEQVHFQEQYFHSRIIMKQCISTTGE
jgi:inorganic pyrophosphatase